MAADSALSFVVGRLGELLADEAALLVGVRDEVEWMREQLKWMKSFLEDAYVKRRRRIDVAKDWERAVRDVSYDAEDIIESYMFVIIRRRQQSVRCCWILKPVETYARELKPRHKLGVEIKKLKAKINQIKENVTTFGLVQSAPSSATYTTLHRQRITFPQPSDNVVVVGFDDHKREILQDLLNTGIARRCVKSIVGMGGLGKTTLANMVFNSDEIKSYFDTRAWVCVSQNCNPVDLFKIIGERIAGTEFQGLGELALREKIYQFLDGKRYFITMDDVWSVEDWKLLECVFPDNRNGSRVLITTRFETVASFTNDLPMGLQNLLPVGSFVAGPLASIICPLEFRRRIEEDHGKDLWKLLSSDAKLRLKDLLKQQEDLLKQVKEQKELLLKRGRNSCCNELFPGDTSSDE